MLREQHPPDAQPEPAVTPEEAATPEDDQGDADPEELRPLNELDISGIAGEEEWSPEPQPQPQPEGEVEADLGVEGAGVADEGASSSFVTAAEEGVTGYGSSTPSDDPALWLPGAVLAVFCDHDDPFWLCRIDRLRTTADG